MKITSSYVHLSRHGRSTGCGGGTDGVANTHCSIAAVTLSCVKVHQTLHFWNSKKFRRWDTNLCISVQGGAETVQVRRLIQSSPRELLILETATPLRRGHRYGIAFSQYRGVIANDLRGLYRSTYRDKRDQQRYVVDCSTVWVQLWFVYYDEMGPAYGMIKFAVCTYCSARPVIWSPGSCPVSEWSTETGPRDRTL